jgi:hypothetical protein
MMNSLPAGFYLPVYVTEDPSKKLFFLSPDHQSSLKRAFGHFDELKNLSSLYKVSYFMTAKDINIGPRVSSMIRPIMSTPREEVHFASQSTYDQWLEDKVILRTERFFPGRPVWNIASTRHALLGDYQFKGVGFTGITGRADYPHISGDLDLYLALYETVVSWHFKETPMRSQKVVALWKDDHPTNPKILMLREANSFRLAQVMGIDLEAEEKNIILRSLNISEEDKLVDKFFDVLKGYAWFVAHSYEYTSPTFDNLMIDGSLIDCSSILHYNGNGWSVPFHLSKGPENLWGVYYNLNGEILTFLTYTHRAYKNLGLELEFDTALDYFWNELRNLVGDRAEVVRTFFNNQKNWKDKSLEDWEKHLRSSLPEAEVTAVTPEQSRFYRGPVEEDKLSYLITFPVGPQVNFSPYKVTDLIFQLLNSNRDVSPVKFAEAIIRSVR